MKFRLFLATLLASAALTTTAFGSVTLYQQNSADLFNGAGQINVPIFYADGIGGVATQTSITTEAGGFRLTDANDGTGNNFIAWCLDLTHYLNLPAAYTITDTPYSNGPDLTAVRSNVERLFGVYYSTDLENNVYDSAAFQLALWEIVFEDPANSYDVASNGGDFYSTASVTGSVVTKANAFLSTFQAMTPVKAYEFTYYESLTDKQNLVTVNPVPLPAAGWLLGAGLLGLYGLSRRKKG